MIMVPGMDCNPIVPVYSLHFLSVLKAWVGEMSHVQSVSTETVHTAQCHVIVVSSTRGTVICLRLTVEKDWL